MKSNQNSIKKARNQYLPPQVMQLDDLEKGQGDCVNGSGDVNNCTIGNSANFGCSNGAVAGFGCTSGSSGGF